MLPDIITTVIKLLEEGGPWAIVVFISWAYLRKDKECKSIYKDITEITKEQTLAIQKFTTTIEHLREVILFSKVEKKPEVNHDD